MIFFLKNKLLKTKNLLNKILTAIVLASKITTLKKKILNLVPELIKVQVFTRRLNVRTYLKNPEKV
jgi:hypothetical protein